MLLYRMKRLGNIRIASIDKVYYIVITARTVITQISAKIPYNAN